MNYLREWRKNKNLTQEELASQIEEPRGTYQAYESGRSPIPSDVQGKIRRLGFKGEFPTPSDGVTREDLDSFRQEVRSQVGWLREESRKENTALAAMLQEVLARLSPRKEI